MIRNVSTFYCSLGSCCESRVSLNEGRKENTLDCDPIKMVVVPSSTSEEAAYIHPSPTSRVRG